MKRSFDDTLTMTMGLVASNGNGINTSNIGNGKQEYDTAAAAASNKRARIITEAAAPSLAPLRMLRAWPSTIAENSWHTVRLHNLGDPTLVNSITNSSQQHQQQLLRDMVFTSHISPIAADGCAHALLASVLLFPRYIDVELQAHSSVHRTPIYRQRYEIDLQFNTKVVAHMMRYTRCSNGGDASAAAAEVCGADRSWFDAYQQQQPHACRRRVYALPETAVVAAAKQASASAVAASVPQFIMVKLGNSLDDVSDECDFLIDNRNRPDILGNFVHAVASEFTVHLHPPPPPPPLSTIAAATTTVATAATTTTTMATAQCKCCCDDTGDADGGAEEIITHSVQCPLYILASFPFSMVVMEFWSMSMYHYLMEHTCLFSDAPLLSAHRNISLLSASVAATSEAAPGRNAVGVDWTYARHRRGLARSCMHNIIRKIHALYETVRHGSRLLYTDIKLENVVCHRRKKQHTIPLNNGTAATAAEPETAAVANDDDDLAVQLCDFGSVLRSDAYESTSTYPPPEHPTGFIVAAEEHDIVWSVGIMLLQFACSVMSDAAVATNLQISDMQIAVFNAAANISDATAASAAAASTSGGSNSTLMNQIQQWSTIPREKHSSSSSSTIPSLNELEDRLFFPYKMYQFGKDRISRLVPDKTAHLMNLQHWDTWIANDPAIQWWWQSGNTVETFNVFHVIRRCLTWKAEQRPSLHDILELFEKCSER